MAADDNARRAAMSTELTELAGKIETACQRLESVDKVLMWDLGRALVIVRDTAETVRYDEDGNRIEIEVPS